MWFWNISKLNNDFDFKVGMSNWNRNGYFLDLGIRSDELVFKQQNGNDLWPDPKRDNNKMGIKTPWHPFSL